MPKQVRKDRVRGFEEDNLLCRMRKEHSSIMIEAAEDFLAKKDDRAFAALG